MSVHTQRGFRKRYGYVIDHEDGSMFVSRHVYGSAEAAQKAGEKDEAQSKVTERWLDEQADYTIHESPDPPRLFTVYADGVRMSQHETLEGAEEWTRERL